MERTLFSQYGRYNLAFALLPLTSAAVIGARPADFVGGVVASGRVANVTAGTWQTVSVRPPCVADLCQQSLAGLTGATPYQVGDDSGGPLHGDPLPAARLPPLRVPSSQVRSPLELQVYLAVAGSGWQASSPPAVVNFTTAPVESGPPLLPPTGPSNITASGFSLTANSLAAGGVYWEVLQAEPGISNTAVPPGSWIELPALPTAQRRRLQALQGGRVAGWAHGRGLAASSNPVLPAIPAPGSLAAPVCPAGNSTCSTSNVFAGVTGISSFIRVAAGCTPLPAAGTPAALPPAAGLQNNTLYYVLLSTEDRALPAPNRLSPPAVYVVHTIDLSAPTLMCGFPAVTGITAGGFTVSAVLTKPGAASYVVLPSEQVRPACSWRCSWHWLPCLAAAWRPLGALPIHRLAESAPAAGLGGTQRRRGPRGQGSWRHPRNGGRVPGRHGSAALADCAAALQWQHTRAICHHNRSSARRQLHGGNTAPGRSSTGWTGNSDVAPMQILGGPC